MLNLKLCSQRHFRTKSNSYDVAFFTSVQPYFKNVLNSVKLPLGSVFYATHPFVKNLQLRKLWEKKSFVNNGTCFFSKFEIMQWKFVINKEGFLN